MMRETMDEAIDRVAAAMTAVPADPGFAARVDARLATRASVAWRWVALPGAAAAVVVAAIAFVLPGNDEAARSRPQPARAALPSAAMPVRVIPPPVAALMRPAAVRRDGVRPQRDLAAEEDEVFVTRIAALPAPDPLSVDALSLESLSIAPVDVANLDLPVIGVGDIPGGEPKEP